jgi:hypothetical protein
MTHFSVSRQSQSTVPTEAATRSGADRFHDSSADRQAPPLPFFARSLSRRRRHKWLNANSTENGSRRLSTTFSNKSLLIAAVHD